MKNSSITNILRSYPPWWLLTALVSLGLTLALTLNLSPWLRGDEDWRWAYTPIFSLDRVLLVALCLLAYILAAAWAWRWVGDSRRRAWLAVSGAVVLTIPIQLIAFTINNPDPLSVILFRTTSPFMSGFHEIGVQVDNVSDYLRDFPQLAADYHPHPQRRPPGLILFFAGLERALSASPPVSQTLAAWLFRYRCEYWPTLYLSDAEFAAAAGGLLTLFFNAVALWPFFAVTQNLLGQRAALAATLFSPLIPGYVLWAGIWDQALVLITALLLWLLYQALVERKHWLWLPMGALISFGSFITYAILPLAGFVVVCTALEMVRDPVYRRGQFKQWVRNALGFGAGLASLWVAYWLILGVTFLDVYRATTEQHFAMLTSYGSRLIYNPYDFAFYLGFPVGLLVLLALWRTARAWLGRQELTAAHSFAAASFLMLGGLTLLNLSRAEVGRVWVLYMPLIVLAVFALADGPAQSIGRWMTTALLVAAQLVMMLSVFVGEESYTYAYPQAVPSEAAVVNARFGEAIELVGYNLSSSQASAGDQILLKLHWRALQPPPGQYVIFVHLYHSQLGLAAQHDGPPRSGQYPTRCWQVGEVITDDLLLTIDPNAPPGLYDVIVGLYDPGKDNERLPVTGPNVHDLSIVLAQIEVK